MNASHTKLKKGYDDIVSLLLTAGAPVNCRVIEDFSTPLHKACAGGKPGHLSAVKQLIAGNADVHSLNKWRETPLLTAANHGQAKAVEALLDAGGDPCKCTDTGWSPLSIAAYKGHDDVVRLLLEQGAPTEEADPTLSALLQAATKGLPDTVELLLRHGADHTVTTKKGDTALSILVEQNLIDAAVEMVTEYKASVTRCSRDRKKVTRARLLINLRVKQQQREGLLNHSDEDSDNDESDERSKSPLHDLDGRPRASSISSKKKTKKKCKSKESAEAQAAEAAEALLREIDQEEVQAEKDKAAANSRRTKKKKKKERERQQKEEERLRQEKVKRETEELKREKQFKEDRVKKERERQQEEKEKEKEMREAAARERVAATLRKETEKKTQDQAKKEKKKKEQQKKERLRRKAEMAAKSDHKQPKSHDVNTSSKEKNIKSISENVVANNNQMSNSTSASYASESVSGSNNRGWEMTNNIASSQTSSVPSQQENQQMNPSSSKPSGNANNTINSSVDLELENMANSVVGFLDESGVPGSSGTEVSNDSTEQSLQPDAMISSGLEGSHPMYQNSSQSFAIETAALSIFRQEKVNELLHLVNSSTPVDVQTVKAIIYKWIVRASYESTPFLDPVIPSWTDSNELIAFFQRQIISESNRAGTVVSEYMKEAGTYLAKLCFASAKEVVDFSKKYGERLPQGVSDSSLNMIASEMHDCTVISIDWNGHSKVYLPALSFTNLRNRYTGPPHLMLTSIFSTMKRYETIGMITAGTSLDCSLPLSTLNALSTHMKVSIEILSNPRTVLGKNSFCGLFADIDYLFGGSKPFPCSNNVENILSSQGGCAAVLPPLDSNTTSVFMKKIANILEVSEGNGLPVSIVVFLPLLCFRDLKTTPRFKDLAQLEPRFLSTHQHFVRHIETLHPSQHAFQSDGNQNKISRTGSIILFLQNEGGRMNFTLTEHTVGTITQSLSVPKLADMGLQQISQPPSPIKAADNNGLNHEYNNANQTVSNLFPGDGSGSSRRRGRLFDLVDDGEDDINDVSGMLNNLNVSMFQNNPSQDVDIEAISLGFMNPSHTRDNNNGSSRRNFNEDF